MRRKRNRPAAKPTRRPTARPEAADAVEVVLALVDGTRIADIEVDWNGTHVRVKREPSSRVFPPEEPRPPDDNATTVTSSYVGVFHRQPASAFPEVGSPVAAGQIIAHVETLRIENAVVAPAEGILAELLVADGTPVEYGQPLAILRPEPTDDADDAGA